MPALFFDDPVLIIGHAPIAIQEIEPVAEDPVSMTN
jgi:hypothetical protein